MVRRRANCDIANMSASSAYETLLCFLPTYGADIQKIQPQTRTKQLPGAAKDRLWLERETGIAPAGVRWTDPSAAPFSASVSCAVAQIMGQCRVGIGHDDAVKLIVGKR